MDDLAGCYDTAADGVSLVRNLLNEEAERGTLERALELLAEAQSALRGAVEDVGYDEDDKDQFKVFLWLKATAWRRQFFIQRHMRNDDVADPTSWPEIGRRIEALDAHLQQVRQRARQYQSRLNRIRYHLKTILEGRDGDRQHDWDVVIETVDLMVRDGVPPSNTDIRELLLPVVDQLPERDLPDGFRRVVREIDGYLATRPAASDREANAEPSAQVKDAAALLRDKVVVLIGGVRRPQAHEALRQAFDLKDVDWVETKEHESITTFEPHIARPEVALVLLAIRWSSHAYGDVRQYCERYGKPLVRLPAGYNPNQVAVQILSQVGEKLRAMH
jgi:hypothetical protein